jgi:hypothetical protein
MDRASRSATVDIPELLRSINYFPQNGHAMFRIIITLGVVPDMAYDAVSREYQPPKWYNAACFPAEARTTWHPSLEGMPAATLSLMVKEVPPDESWSLMLSIGIQYGALHEGGEIKEVKRFGAAKIMALIGRSNDNNVSLNTDETQASDLVEEVVDAALDAQVPPRQAFCYHYVSTVVPAPPPAMSVYTYVCAPTEVAVVPARAVGTIFQKTPVQSVAFRQESACQVPEYRPERVARTDGAGQGQCLSQKEISVPRYITFGQWRL